MCGNHTIQLTEAHVEKEKEKEKEKDKEKRFGTLPKRTPLRMSSFQFHS